MSVMPGCGRASSASPAVAPTSCLLPSGLAHWRSSALLPLPQRREYFFFPGFFLFLFFFSRLFPKVLSFKEYFFFSRLFPEISRFPCFP